MSLSKKIQAYPHSVRSLFYMFAQTEDTIEKTIPFSNPKVATRERAKMYQLRRLLADAAHESGNELLSEKFFTVGIRLTQRSDGGADLTLYSQHTPFSSEIMDAAEEVLSTAGASKHTAPTVSSEEMEEFNAKMLREAQDSDSSVFDKYFKLSGEE